MSSDIPDATIPASTLDVLNPARIARSNPKARKMAQCPAFDAQRFRLASAEPLDHFEVRSPGPLGGGLAAGAILAPSNRPIGGGAIRLMGA